jgi:hypothetical protein
VYPKEKLTCTLKHDSGRKLQTAKPDHQNIELQGLLIELTERPHHANKCSQRFADVTLFPENLSLLYITGEVAHFSVEITSSSSPPEEKFFPSRHLEILPEFDSTASSNAATSWDLDSEYRTPYARLHLRDTGGNISQYYYPRWYDHWPPLKLNFPHTLRGSTLARLLKEGIDLVMILEIKVLEGEDLQPFHLVLCLGVDRSEEPATRFGMYCLPKEVWVKASPSMRTVMMG